MKSLIAHASAFALIAAVATGCGSFSDFVDDNKNKLDIPVTTDYEFVTSFDIGGAMGAAAGKPSPAELKKAIAPPPSKVDLVLEVPALSDAKGRVKSFEILKIVVTPTTNTVTSDLPAFDLYIGPMDAKDTSGSAKIATIPAIKAGSTAVVNAVLDAAGQKAAQQWLTTLAFSQGMVATMIVKKGENVPSGKADLKIAMGLKVVLNPIK
ncbi:MAG: hypothetical protein KC502_21640 [Myxococcales bacterium]|nr:hypothetical protein [Myxococcales bacterium]